MFHSNPSPAARSAASPAIDLSRRAALTLVGAGLVSLAMPRIARAAAPFPFPPLPYEEGALAPTISARTVGLHYGKHHKGYYDKLNVLVQGKPYADMTLEEVVVASRKAGDAAIFNNAAQAWNHDLYWMEFKGGPNPPKGAFADAMKSGFGDLAGLKKAMTDTGDNVFGTGWVWLARNGDKLEVIGMKDAIDPLPDGKKVLAGIDVWEHAYYLDWENRRTAHVKAVLDDRMNWAFVSERWG